MKKVLLSIVAMMAISAPVANAIEFLDQGLPDKLFVFGVRGGVNVSNLSDNKYSVETEMRWSNHNWKAGFTAGAVCDINIRNFLTLQPGFFFQTRSNEYDHMSAAIDGTSVEYQKGSRCSYYFQIPILASYRVMLTEEIQGQIDFGPYFMYGLGGEDDFDYFGMDFDVPENERIKQFSGDVDYFGDKGAIKGYDWGFKFGTGVVFLEKYYLGIHYEAGCRDVWKDRYKGFNKAWNFTVGYNF